MIYRNLSNGIILRYFSLKNQNDIRIGTTKLSRALRLSRDAPSVTKYIYIWECAVHCHRAYFTPVLVIIENFSDMMSSMTVHFTYTIRYSYLYLRSLTSIHIHSLIYIPINFIGSHNSNNPISCRSYSLIYYAFNGFDFLQTSIAACEILNRIRILQVFFFAYFACR